VWNEVISHCVGFEQRGPGEESPLPCYPSTVVYGHTASRGLDVHRWTVGLDTGCVCCTVFPYPAPYDSCPRSTVGGLRHSFWMMRIHIRKTFLLALMMATTTMMTMTTTSSQATGQFLSVTTVKRSFSVSSATSKRCRSFIPFCLFRICTR
jgi:hypothetical protein